MSEAQAEASVPVYECGCPVVTDTATSDRNWTLYHAYCAIHGDKISLAAFVALSERHGAIRRTARRRTSP